MNTHLPTARSQAILFTTRWRLAASCSSTYAWGPHPEITHAALHVLRPSDAIVKQLGGEAMKLRDHAWMPGLAAHLRGENSIGCTPTTTCFSRRCPRGTVATCAPR